MVGKSFFDLWKKILKKIEDPILNRVLRPFFANSIVLGPNKEALITEDNLFSVKKIENKVRSLL